MEGFAGSGRVPAGARRLRRPAAAARAAAGGVWPLNHQTKRPRIIVV